ncbi:MAG: hypothetical protein K1X75_02830 [Leptospirales bacterium]|nr:hypothetical protein [Leptospirales bacterium]
MIQWKFWRPRDFDPGEALELLRLVGRAYVQYFEERYGASPEDWRPRSMRSRYERYRPGHLPAEYQLLEVIRWRQTRRDAWPIGFLAARGKQRLLIFRGTIHDSEWLRDLQLAQVPCPFMPRPGLSGGSVHRGFARIYSSLRPAPAELRALIGGGPLTVAGHSLGGALATLAALELHAIRPRVYVVGSPRVGDGRFAGLFDRLVPQSWRIENVWDPIVDTPVEDVRILRAHFPYRHAGRVRPIFSLSKIDGERLAHAIARGRALSALASDGDLDILFTHQLRTYEHGLTKMVHGSI